MALIAGVVDTILKAYHLATGEFVNADWTHDLVIEDVFQGVLCHQADFGDDRRNVTCDTCTQAWHDAQAAESLAARAVWQIGNWWLVDALETATQAAAIEHTWGDAPTWRPFVMAIETGLETLSMDMFREEALVEIDARLEQTKPTEWRGLERLVQRIGQ